MICIMVGQRPADLSLLDAGLHQPHPSAFPAASWYFSKDINLGPLLFCRICRASPTDDKEVIQAGEVPALGTPWHMSRPVQVACLSGVGFGLFLPHWPAPQGATCPHLGPANGFM